MQEKDSAGEPIKYVIWNSPNLVKESGGQALLQYTICIKVFCWQKPMLVSPVAPWNILIFTRKTNMWKYAVHHN